MSTTVALVGRPNVGKSTLFNRLVGRRLALVDDQPGVTRDLREGDARLGPLRFRVIDTAGLDDAAAGSLEARMSALSERAIAAADVCLFMIDARAGVTPADEVLAGLLRRTAQTVILVANKAEGRAGEGGYYDAFALGLGDPIALSAEHGEGLEDLLARLSDHVAAPGATATEPPEEEGEGIDPAKPVQIAIMGRPNAGKSTLANRILGEDRLLTGPEAGITRDAIALDITWGGRLFRVFDTAGMRKRARVQEKLEKLAVSDGLRAVRFAEVVVLLVDAASPFDTQDLRLADLVEREGRALVVAVSKWDLARDRGAAERALRSTLERSLPQLRGVSMVTLSGLTGQGLDRLNKAILEAHKVWNARIPTARLNTWLAGEVAHHPPPAPGGRRLKLRYITQVKSRPPSFVVFCSVPDALPEDYKRFLVAGLRRDFDLPGTPIRLLVRGGANPYKDRKPRRKTALDKHRTRKGEQT
ncbi:MAG: ribosome biogenesis GTPase Der [Pseudomonadota bacterium]